MEHSAKNALFCCEKRGYSQAFLQNFVDFVVRQLLAAAGGDVGGIRDGSEVGIGGDAQLRKGSGQSNLFNLRGQRVDTGGGFPVTALGCDAPDILSKPRKPRKPRRTRLVDVAVQNGMDHRQPCAVVAVGVRAQLMLDLMRLKIRDLADLQHAVFRHRGRPRLLTSGFVILRVGQQNADVADDAAHDGLIDIIGEVVFIYKYRL